MVRRDEHTTERLPMKTRFALSILSLLAVVDHAHAGADVPSYQPSCAATLENCNGSPTGCIRDFTFTNSCAPICAAATPSLAQCTATEAWYKTECGKAEMSKIEAHLPTSKCLSAIRGVPLTRYNPVTRMLPSDTFHDAYAPAAAGTGVPGCTSGSGSCAVRLLALHRPVTVNTPMSADYHGIMHGQAFGPTALLPDQTRLESRHAAWRADLAAANTCEEYVFHRFEGYSMFEDATLEFEHDPRRVFNVAYSVLNSLYDLRAKRAIGGLGAIFDWNWDALRVDDMFPGGTQPKNDVLGFRFVPAISGGPEGWETVRDPAVLSANPTIVDADLLHKLEAAQAADPGHRETFAWHKAQSDAMAAAGFSDEELERVAELRKRFMALMVERAEVLTLTLHCPEAVTYLDTLDVRASSPWETLDPVWDPSKPLGESLPVLNQMESFAGHALLRDAFGGSYFAPVEGDDAFMRGCMPEFSPEIAPRLNAIDARLESVLHEADALGCLETTPSRCDWAPSDFHRRARGLFVAARQTAYEECVSMVPGGQLAGPLGAVLNTAFCDGGVCASVPHPRTGVPTTCTTQSATVDYRRNPDLVQIYFACTRAFKAQLDDKMRAELGALGTYSNAGGSATMSQAYGDAYSAGQAELFGMSASYSARWDLAGMREADMCTSHAGVSAGTNLSVKVLGLTQTLLDAQAGLRMNDPSSLSVRVLGEEIAPAIGPAVSFGASTISGNPGRTQEFFSHSQVFMVGPFPVRVSAAASGRAGLEYSLESSCENGRRTAGMTGTFRPYASINAEGSAGLSAVVAEAGIKIDLVLAELGLPLKASLVADMTTPAPNGHLSLDTQLDFEARFLDGAVSLYAEVCYAWPLGCQSWDDRLFSWSGLRTQTQLFKTALSIALAPLAGP